MPTPDKHEPEDKPISVREGYEVTDVSVPGVLVFIIALGISLGVFLVFCFGMGKVINIAIKKHDGPSNKWSQLTYTGDTKPRNMESSPVLEQKELNRLTQNFPTPRLQNDDGDQDVADMHAREDLLLNHYSWIDRSKGTVRIPISRAMELIAERGLPVAPRVQMQPLMVGDSKPTIQVPLTDGFARTAYEQQQRSSTKEPGEQTSTKADNY